MVPSHIHTGIRGEKAAARYMEEQGYLVIQRNWRHGKSEIDLICGKGSELVFVEVKTRQSGAFGEPECFVTSAKRSHMLKAADAFLHALKGDYCLRFDVISVKLFGTMMELRHFEDAFHQSAIGWNT
ncbi:MAG: YraN family protein [Bacteroidota bacterium]|nr:YraN family protein [Bacteroidota bacterium]MDX5431359.1 YraN family protein [Bacteroidota bacterium]MDX5470089.1 YraN family protein [Bacteroidota bacterium]